MSKSLFFKFGISAFLLFLNTNLYSASIKSPAQSAKSGYIVPDDNQTFGCNVSYSIEKSICDANYSTELLNCQESFFPDLQGYNSCEDMAQAHRNGCYLKANQAYQTCLANI